MKRKHWFLISGLVVIAVVLFVVVPMMKPKNEIKNV